MLEQHRIEIARAFVAAVAASKPRDVIESFYTEDIIHEVHPNLLAPDGVVRDFINVRAAYDRSRHVIRAQTYNVVNALASGDTVVIEVVWSATLASNLSALKAGDTVRARFAQFFEFRGDKICRIRNYDCFEPFAKAGTP